ncbi:patatin-like phospholipase family protein [Salegentibacter tibetensis]|uniref:patatin-like phospholipase family protein n=1 Tax=Salegentibacter tibetensis TaxID=2873600 RepID=UPI0021D43A8F|nr:patatin-like phospholipase family protein [Salegentibacter tibetensis]
MIQKKIEKRGSIFWNLVLHGWGIWKLLRSKLGINPGDHFENWLSTSLEKFNIYTYQDLCANRDNIPNLKHRTRQDFKFNPPKMAIITSDITTHTKVEFPRMGELYWENINKLKPSKFVRASMSIPFFFYPYEVKNIPNTGNVADEKWQAFASYNGEVPPAVKFVDGGMLSNFPINTFHVGGIPTRPTFGVRLSTHRQKFSPADEIFGFSGAMISTMRQISDYEFILKNPDYKKLICKIDADAEFNWLNFGMNPKRQKELFTLGAKKGLEFLKTFDWKGYKEIRKNC